MLGTKPDKTMKPLGVLIVCSEKGSRCLCLGLDLMDKRAFGCLDCLCSGECSGPVVQVRGSH